MPWLVKVLFLVLLTGNFADSSRVKRIIGGAPAEEPPFYNITRPTTTTPEPSPTPDPLVFVRKDKRSAIVNGIQNEDGTSSFLGIRYAAPPLKRLRFQRPRRLKLKGEIDAKKFGPPCPQWSPYKKGAVIGQEDCLFLNVFTPEAPVGDKKPSYPVLVWIHGGNFRSGSAAQYVPTHIVKKGVVVVTLNYRLGSLGFLSLGRKELPGNSGLFDIAAAMRWVKDYIRFFGGNPRKITPGGQGSGASCATMLALNSFTRSSLSGVLAMSGSAVSPFSMDENENTTAKEISSEDGCKTEEGLQFVRCMQQLPLEQILKGDTNVEDKRKKKNTFPKGLANLLSPGPAEEGKEDGRFLPNFVLESPLQAIQKGIFPTIPLMTGVTKEETGGGVKGNFLGQITKQLLSPSFLQSGLFNGALNANTGLFVNRTVNPQLSSLFLNGDYLKFFTMIISSALSDLDKVIKHTTDAFFNLPAFITSHLWSKKNKVYLYSFEHTPKKSLAGKFLPGIPMVASESASNDKKKGPEHGDDLMYLFDIRSLEGEPLNNSFTDADEKVREHFTSMVAEFARAGTPKSEGSDAWSPFSEKEGNYMIITEKPKLAKNFRKCEMGLWTGDNNILNSPDCSVLNQAGKIVTDTIGSAGSSLLTGVNDATTKLGLDKLSDLTGEVSKITNPLGGLLGSKSSSKTSTTVKPTSTVTNKKGLLGGLGGQLFG